MPDKACVVLPTIHVFPCGTMQAVVLMLFNDADTLSLADIAAGSGVEDKELRRTLQSLACGKVIRNTQPCTHRRLRMVFGSFNCPAPRGPSALLPHGENASTSTGRSQYHALMVPGPPRTTPPYAAGVSGMGLVVIPWPCYMLAVLPTCHACHTIHAIVLYPCRYVCW